MFQALAVKCSPTLDSDQLEQTFKQMATIKYLLQTALEDVQKLWVILGQQSPSIFRLFVFFGKGITANFHQDKDLQNCLIIFFYCVIVKYRRVLKSKKLKVFIFLITSSKPKDIKGCEAVHLDKRQQ